MTSNTVTQLQEIADLNNDGQISAAEIEIQERVRLMEDRDARRDAMRRMTWVMLSGIILYPVAVIASVMYGLTDAANILGDLASTYFVTGSGVIAAFFGSQAYMDRR
jgi:hypothetical protein